MLRHPLRLLNRPTSSKRSAVRAASSCARTLAHADRKSAIAAVGQASSASNAARSVAPARTSAGVPQKPADASRRCSRSCSATVSPRAAKASSSAGSASSSASSKPRSAARIDRSPPTAASAFASSRRSSMSALRVAAGLFGDSKWRASSMRSASMLTGLAITSANPAAVEGAPSRFIAARCRRHSGRPSRRTRFGTNACERLRAIEPGHARIEQQQIERRAPRVRTASAPSRASSQPKPSCAIASAKKRSVTGLSSATRIFGTAACAACDDGRMASATTIVNQAEP